MERLHKSKSPNSAVNNYIVGPMHLEDGTITTVFVALPKDAGKVIIVSVKEDRGCVRK